MDMQDDTAKGQDTKPMDVAGTPGPTDQPQAPDMYGLITQVEDLAGQMIQGLDSTPDISAPEKMAIGQLAAQVQKVKRAMLMSP